jgi:hypothetical protein
MSKCDSCNKKIKLVEQITSKCKCGKIYCGNHKIDHNCDYDYRNEFKNQISSIMITITSDKLDKI